MWPSALVAYLHYASFAAIVAALAIEHLTLQPDLDLRRAWRLVVADSIYGLAGVAVLVTGVLRVMYYGKGSEFYLHSGLFWVKIALFAIAGVLSLYPTITFLGWIQPLREGKPPELAEPAAARLTQFVRVELAIFFAIPLFAAAMARGLGFGV